MPNGLADIRVQQDGLSVTGDLDFGDVMSVYTQSLPLLATRQTWQIDLSGVRHSNSAGLSLLLAWLHYAKSHHKTIRFTHIPEKLLNVAKVAGILEILA